MGKLTDILSAGNGDDIRDLWNSTEAADEFAPLPKGEYIAHIIAGELEQSESKGTPGYKLTFRVCEGEFVGRRFWHHTWLTPAALAMAKRDLSKLGVTSLEQLEQPLPARLRCKAKVVLHRNDDGGESNKVKRFDVLGIDPPEQDAFAPTDDAETDDAAADGDGSPDQATEADADDQSTADDSF